MRSIGTDIHPAMALDCRITHRPAEGEPASCYLELLAWGQWEEPTNLRMLHYYGRELMFRGYPQDAIARFERYLELDAACAFPAEHDLTRRYLDQCKAALP